MFVVNVDDNSRNPDENMKNYRIKLPNLWGEAQPSLSAPHHRFFLVFSVPFGSSPYRR